jgi:hypothetical protein
MTDDTALAELLAFVLAGRPERLTEMAVAQMPPEQQAAVAAVTEAVGSLAVAGQPEAPPGSVRERILATLRGRAERHPRRAVLVCDMINDHLTPGRSLEVPRAPASGDR